MSVISEYIERMRSYELVDEKTGVFSDCIQIEDAIDILEQFEVAMINELDCEQLLKLKNGYTTVSESQ